MEVGGQLLRPVGSWSGAVHEYLRHLESAGFTGAPRFLGVEGDREVLTFIEGSVPVDPHWQPGRGHRLPAYARSEAALTTAAGLVRRLHEAARGYRRAILPALRQCPTIAAERVRHAPVNAAEAAETLEYHARDLRWLHSVTPDLDRELAP